MTTKDERIGIRVPSETKHSLLQIARKEGRSLAQVCEILLRAEIHSYEKKHFVARIEKWLLIAAPSAAPRAQLFKVTQRLDDALAAQPIQRPEQKQVKRPPPFCTKKTMSAGLIPELPIRSEWKIASSRSCRPLGW